jgi:porin
MIGWRRRGIALVALAACLPSGRAHAAPPPLAAPINLTGTSATAVGGWTNFLSNLNRSNYMLGDLFGVRTFLARYGISLAVQETSEVLGNVSGGIHKGADYDGLTQMILQLNTDRAFGWHGGLFNASALQIHGRNLSADNLGTIQTASGIEADRATRLWELWYDQKFLDEDAADIKIGQQSVDQEFITSANAALFVNTMFGWPAVPSYDMPGGGPAYPLSAPGIRLRWRFTEALTVLTGVFSGSPAPNRDGDPQALNASGTSFPLDTGTLVMTEIQDAYPGLGAMEYPGAGAPLGHVYKLGFWYDSDGVDDQRFGNDGLPLADPASNGITRHHRGNFGVYGVFDQMLWRQSSDPNRTMSVFGRALFAPQADRNFLRASLNLGVTYREPIKGRADDTVGLAVGYARVSSSVSNADRDAREFGQVPGDGLQWPIRRNETFIETTYQYQMRPWWQIQPDFQYVFNPGGGIANPNDQSRKVKDEAVIGVRTNVLF